MADNGTYRPSEQDVLRLKKLRPMDDDFMRCMFKDDLELTQFVLRIIMRNQTLTLESSETQKDIKRLQGARSISLDIYGLDAFGSKYDLEIQRADKGAGAKRARYHGSIIDAESLHALQEFDELPDTYIIFITENDVFGAGAPFYPIERVNMVTKKVFPCGQHILYVNGAYDGDDDIGRLMHDFRSSDANDMYFVRMAEKTRYLKENPKGVSEVCKMLEEMREESFAKGKAEGKAEGILASIRSLMESMHMSVQQAMDALRIPPSEQENYMKQI